MKIKLVVDSTCDVPKELIEKHDISVVPLTINWMGGSFKDGVDMTSDELYAKLVSVDDHPKTSQPPVGEFAEVYQKALDSGYDKIISVHITGGFSGTTQSAQTAAEMVGSDKVKIIDSQTTTMGAGWLAVKIIEAMEQGLEFHQIVEQAEKLIETTKVVIYLDTLEYAVRGGRVSKLKGVVGSMLNVKPVIYFENGTVKEFSKSRGKNKAIDSFIASFEKLWGVDANTPIKIALAYGTDKAYAEEVLGRMKEKYNLKEGFVFQAGVAIAVHGGPDFLAACGTW
ncbi:DegV family protein [Alkalicella caledoniensis]|uniref:DegV family protein n=1 Tax=Alkalicella caledoniensis TaxID=2731377 RepID=A0A7G9W6T9_ALKCA|nr:DegV family protein [Alkalicella caledoniensis]QNO14401.1 DegV family protein [Alkalicella caledoniensis]